MPKLSIGIPVFNGQDYLPELLDSLLAQTFRDFEILICDNASTDRTARICGEYRRRDSRIQSIRNHRNVGAIRNYNRVFELCSSPFFKWAAHDDVHHSRYLETCVGLLEQDQDTVLAHTGTAFIDETSEILPFDEQTGSYVDRASGRRYWPDAPDIANDASAVKRFWHVLNRARWGSHMYGVVRREALRETSLLPDFAGSDRAMLAELALLGRFRAASEPLFLKRVHATGSAALDQKTLRRFLSADGKRYSRRLRQIRAFFGAPIGKPIGVVAKSACCLLVATHSIKVAVQSLDRKDPRMAQQYGSPGVRTDALRRKRCG